MNGASTPDGPSSLSPQPSSLEQAASVLVVDDNSINRYMLSQHVTQLGLTPDSAENGRVALEKLRERPYDLVLLDVQMPELDGYGVLEEMKSDAALREIPVIVVSGVDELESVVRCVERGAADYLTKPFNPTLLKARIGACLEKKRLSDEQRENYRRLQELERLRDSLVHMVVHDLRTPLTSLLTGLYTLDMLGELPADQKECWTMSVQGGETLLAMINDLLDISKMEQESVNLDYSTVDVAALVERGVKQVEHLSRDKGVELSVSVDPEIGPVPADEDKLRRTLVNLLGNAIKFTPRDGRISVSVRAEERGEEAQGVRFAVTDTGEGIPREAFGKIFEKFGQVENRKAGRTLSTGLGLTFCKMAVDAHGGRIWVESEVGKGSTFFFTIPAAGL